MSIIIIIIITMCSNIPLYCALLRLGIYSLYRQICCSCQPPPEKPVFQVLCIGLTGSGKTSLIYAMSKDKLEKEEPTIGFLIKPLEFTNCILEMKELGGSDNIRPYWDHYFQHLDAIIFIVDSGASEEHLKLASNELHKALRNKDLLSIPLLLLANHQDNANARSLDMLRKLFNWKLVSANRPCIIHPCSIKNTDTIEQGFKKLCEKMLALQKIDVKEAQ